MPHIFSLYSRRCPPTNSFSTVSHSSKLRICFSNRTASDFKSTSALMKPLLLRSLATLACLGVFSLPQTFAAARPHHPGKPDFAGSWILERKGTDSLQPLMQEIGAAFHERKLADVINLKADIHQTEQVVTIATRGPGVSINETLYLNGRTEPSTLSLLGATSYKAATAWSSNNQLVTTHHIRTKQGKEGQLIVARRLMNDGKTLVVAYTLRLPGENTTSARQTWQRRA
jgi:hypothetical protein